MAQSATADGHDEAVTFCRKMVNRFIFARPSGTISGIIDRRIRCELSLPIAAAKNLSGKLRSMLSLRGLRISQVVLE